MKRFIVTFFCHGELDDVYVDAKNIDEAIEKASYGMEGSVDAVFDTYTQKLYNYQI